MMKSGKSVEGGQVDAPVDALMQEYLAKHRGSGILFILEDNKKFLIFRPANARIEVPTRSSVRELEWVLIAYRDGVLRDMVIEDPLKDALLNKLFGQDPSKA